jgi:hypothetical protein
LVEDLNLNILKTNVQKEHDYSRWDITVAGWLSVFQIPSGIVAS